MIFFPIFDSEFHRLDASYRPGEILTAIFTPDDAFLSVLTRGGRLDIWELAEGALRFSQMPSLLRQTDLSYIVQMNCQSDPTGHRLIFTTECHSIYSGRFLVVDTDSWLLVGQADHVYGYLPGDGGVYAYRDNAMVRYPLHDLDDLARLAARALGEDGS